jgi:DnaJ-domain-containing protein 1
MATATPTNAPTSSSLSAFEEKVRAEVEQAKTKLEQFEAKAKERRSEAETATINRVKAAKQDIDRRLRDLKATHDVDVAHAKSDIEAAVAKFKASIAELGAK